MTPYYDHAGITIYHGDCRDILPHLEPVDLVLTDPPYLGLLGGVKLWCDGGVSKSINESFSIGDVWDASLDWIAMANNNFTMGAFIFCSYHFVDLIPKEINAKRVALLTWYKRNSPLAVNNVPRFTTEFIWAFKKDPGLIWRNIKNTCIDIPLLQGGCMATERLLDNHGVTLHPTQKPVRLIEFLLSVGGDTILDPFMGSGTTLVAAKQLGRKAVGIEIEERYCEIAVRRLQQECFDFSTGSNREAVQFPGISSPSSGDRNHTEQLSLIDGEHRTGF
jgi:site-specific DNA-methyltransferase (adenine-specific)